MKTDLTTAIITAIVCLFLGYFLTDLIIPEIKSVQFNTVGSGMSYDIVEPSKEVFNYRALNPTVEVYVGECRYEQGECSEEEANVGTALQGNENGSTD